MIIIIAVDYTIWHRADDRIYEVTSPIAANQGSLMGWPFGKEYRIVIERPITDSELHQLEALNEQPRSSWVGILFRSCEVDEERLEEIRERLSECHVFHECDDQSPAVP